MGLQSKTICKNTTHGKTGTSLYEVFKNMHRRCNNKKTWNYKNYGGRGIKICKEWQNNRALFILWALDNGYRNNLQIDRIDNEKGYSPENCRWVTRSTNARNTRKLMSTNTSGYRGVSFRKDNKIWRAYITVNRKRIYLGNYVTMKEVAIAYDQYIIDNNLEHTRNFA